MQIFTQSLYVAYWCHGKKLGLSTATALTWRQRVLIGTLLQRLLLLRLDFFSNLHHPFATQPFRIPQDWLPNTRLIIEGLCNNLSARYPFLRNCGLPKLDFYGYLFAFEAVASNVDDPDQSLLPMQWESVERTVSGIRAGYPHLQFQNGCIGVRISIGNSSVDLLLEVVGSAQHLNPGEYFAKTQDWMILCRIVVQTQNRC